MKLTEKVVQQTGMRRTKEMIREEPANRDEAPVVEINNKCNEHHKRGRKSQSQFKIELYKEYVKN